MKRKVFINGRFLTQPLTGVQRYAYEIILALDESIEEDTISRDEFEFVIIYSGKIRNPISLKNIFLLEKGILSGNLWEQLELPLYTFGSLLVSLCTVSALLKIKQIVVVHDASFEVNPKYFSVLFRSWYRVAIRILIRTCRQIVTVSAFSKTELIKHLGADSKKITVINAAADHMKRFGEPNTVFKNQLNAFIPYCLAVSSLSENKNFKSLAGAFNKTDMRHYKILIAGGKSSSLQHALPADSAIYLGYVSDEELKYLYSNAALFTFPSFYEGFGLPPLEAMSMGCPVAASCTSSLPEILGDACEYFNPHDENDMAEKIQELITDKMKSAELRTKGFLKAKEYSWKNSAMKMLGLIQRFA